MTNSFFTVLDVVRATGISRSAVQLHITRGNLKAEKVGGHMFLISVEEFRRFVAARLTGQYTKQWREADRK